MSVIYPTLPKLATKDGFDDEDLTDIDDEVFIRDGKNGCLKIDEDGGVKRPLMAPRRKCKRSYSFETYKLSKRTCFRPFYCGLIALIILLSLIVFCIYIVNVIPIPMSILKSWLSHDFKDIPNESNVVPCTSLSTKIIWTKSLRKLTPESPLRSTDLNGDGIEDIIIGFSTGLDMMDTPEYICGLYFEGQVPCFGGVLALNGKTGDNIWIHWTAGAIFSVDCSLDLTNDKIKDCIICGWNGILHAVNGYNGSSIWEIPVQHSATSEEWKLLNLYDARFISDINGDDIGDVIASHSIQSREIHSSEILIISGKNGNIIHTSVLPNTEELFFAPQKLIHTDGESIFVLVTSSQKQSGGLYIVPQVNLMYGNLKLRKLHHNTGKGTLLPPILVDITSDGVEDIVAAMFNSTIIVYNGLTFEPIWNYTVPNSEVISIPIPGYYNDDDIPDFMVKHQIGSGFPTYYYTVATIIDGKTGKSLLEKPIEDSLSRQMSGLSVTVEGFGNDWFLHWSIDCLNFEGVKEKYQFLKNENILSESRADLCKLRFNSTQTMNLYALSQHVGPPGISLYYSEDWKTLEFNKSMHSKIEPYVNTLFVSQRSPRIPKNHNIKTNSKPENENSHDVVNGEPYKSYNDYIVHKKYATNDFQTGNDYAWNPLETNGNKRFQNNMEMNGDYDMTYDSDNNDNIGLEKSVDYSQTDEIREKRSNVNDESDISFKYSEKSKVNSLPNIANKTYLFKQSGKYHITFYRKKKEDINIESKTKKKGVVNVSPNSSINTAMESTEEKYMPIIAQAYTYKFSNTIQNEDEDATIEKIFKRESLKNENKSKSIMQKSKFIAKLAKKLKTKTGNEFRKRKEKRETKTDSSRMHQTHGVQKQAPTGILLPSILESKGATSIDLVFSTFWLPTSEVNVILIQEDFDCIHAKKILSGKKLQFQQNDDIIRECLAERGISYKMYQETIDRENFKVSFGQMTVYRIQLECVCPEDMLPNQSCKNISLQQSWPEYLGSQGNGYFKPFRKANH